MKEQDFGYDKRPSAIEGSGYAIDRRPKDVRPWSIIREQDFGI